MLLKFVLIMTSILACECQKKMTAQEAVAELAKEFFNTYFKNTPNCYEKFENPIDPKDPVRIYRKDDYYDYNYEEDTIEELEDEVQLLIWDKFVEVPQLISDMSNGLARRAQSPVGTTEEVVVIAPDINFIPGQEESGKGKNVKKIVKKIFQKKPNATILSLDWIQQKCDRPKNKTFKAIARAKCKLDEKINRLTSKAWEQLKDLLTKNATKQAIFPILKGIISP